MRTLNSLCQGYVDCKVNLASLESASHEAKTVLDYKTPSAPQRRLSREVKAKAPCAYNEATIAPPASITLLGGVKPAICEAKIRAPVCANNVADLASLSAPSAKILCREVRGKARMSAINEALLTSLVGRTLHGRAKFASKGRTRTVERSYPLRRSYLSLACGRKESLKG